MSRDANTDLIRASAIGLVLIHHIGQFLPQLPEVLHRLTSLGAYGVDLFFVLSGWLIGRLYWLEKNDTGTVNTLNFWLRRWLRTIPPYIVVLPIAFLAVKFWRDEPFRWEYLLFLQNYDEKIPFFLVSWSLCVEEHFYLVLPLILMLIARLEIPAKIVLPILVFLSVATRFVDPAASPGTAFGYAETASHLNFTGLTIGVWFSYLSVFEASIWTAVQELCRKITVPLLVGFFTIQYWSDWYVYFLGDIYVSVLWASALASLVSIPAIGISRSRLTYYIALSSYSIYLTHALVINFCVVISDKIGLAREVVFPIWLVLIFIVGFSTYVVVEKSAISFRDRVAPRRVRIPSPNVQRA